jgi:hypothetical protein
VTIGDVQGKPFSVAKIAAYMDVPPTTVIRRLNRLQSWGLIERQGRHYHLHQKALNSLIGVRSYQRVRSILSKAIEELVVLDTCRTDRNPEIAVRKATLASLPSRAAPGLRFSEHMDGADGPLVFEHEIGLGPCVCVWRPPCVDGRKCPKSPGTGPYRVRAPRSGRGRRWPDHE